MIAQVVAGLPLRDGHVKGSACRQRTFLSKACHGWISGERNIFSKSISPGKSLRNRDHEAHCSINVCSSLERRPRCLGGCQRGGGT